MCKDCLHFYLLNFSCYTTFNSSHCAAAITALALYFVIGYFKMHHYTTMLSAVVERKLNSSLDSKLHMYPSYHKSTSVVSSTMIVSHGCHQEASSEFYMTFWKLISFSFVLITYKRWVVFSPKTKQYCFDVAS